MTKAGLRKLFIKKRSELDSSQRMALSERITENLFDSLNFKSLSSVHCYLPMENNNEPETGFIIERIRQDFAQIAVYVPRVDFRSDEIESILLDSKTKLTKNRWGIPEPLNGKTAEPEIFDLVLVPLVCFDKSGNRVGYGKGFYDRFLSRCRKDCIKAGLSFFPPVESISDIHPGDIRLDICFTPEKTYFFN
ncbi:MAG: 5-formyltetrahydrofolate cyclo-ligase [Pyrinomonadaceae bacterium]